MDWYSFTASFINPPDVMTKTIMVKERVKPETTLQILQ